MNQSKPTLKDIEQYSNKHGSAKTGRLLSALGKDKQFVAAWDSSVGKELMGELLSMTDEGLTRIIDETADDRVKAEYRVCMALLNRFKDRINKYQKNFEQLKRG